MNAEAEILASMAKVDAAVKFLQSPFLVARLLEGMENAIIRANSPWLTRKDAAEYCRCSVSEIDRAYRECIIFPKYRGGTPLFLREDLDSAIKSGKWTKAGE